MGYAPSEDGTIKEMDNVHGVEVTGGSLPATIWRRFMTAALKGTPSASFKKPQLEGVATNYGGSEPTAKLAEATKPSAGARPTVTPAAELAAGEIAVQDDRPGQAPPDGQSGEDTLPAAPPPQRVRTPEREQPPPAPKPSAGGFDACFPFCETQD
jgi:penicillin-binding protein 1A